MPESIDWFHAARGVSECCIYTVQSVAPVTLFRWNIFDAAGPFQVPGIDDLRLGDLSLGSLPAPHASNAAYYSTKTCNRVWIVVLLCWILCKGEMYLKNGIFATPCPPCCAIQDDDDDSIWVREMRAKVTLHVLRWGPGNHSAQCSQSRVLCTNRLGQSSRRYFSWSLMRNSIRLVLLHMILILYTKGKAFEDTSSSGVWGRAWVT